MTKLNNTQIVEIVKGQTSVEEAVIVVASNMTKAQIIEASVEYPFVMPAKSATKATLATAFVKGIKEYTRLLEIAETKTSKSFDLQAFFNKYANITEAPSLAIPENDFDAFGNTDEHSDVLTRNIQELDKYFTAKEFGQYFILDDVVLFDKPITSGKEFKSTLLGYAMVQVTQRNVFFIATLKQQEDNSWKEQLLDVVDIGADFVALNRSYNKYVPLNKTYQHQLAGKAGFVKIPLFLVDGNIEAKIKMSPSKQQDGTTNFYHNFKMTNPKEVKFKEDGSVVASGYFNKDFMSVLTQAVRTVCGTAKIGNPQNNILRGTKCTSLLRFFTKDQVDEAKGFNGDMAIFEGYTTTESSKIGSVMPSYVCGETQQFLDIEAVSDVNEASRMDNEAVMGYTEVNAYEDDNGQTSQVRYAGKDDVIIGGKIVNKYEYISEAVNQKCVSCPLFQECGAKSQKQIAEEKAKQVGNENSFVSYTWSEGVKPEHALPMVQFENGKEFFNYPQQVVADRELSYDFGLRGKKGHVVIVSEELLAQIDKDTLETVEFNEMRVQVGRMISSLNNFAFTMHRYSEEVVTKLYNDLLDQVSALDFDHAEVVKKNEQLLNALNRLEEKYNEFKSSNGKIVTEFGDFVVSFEQAKADKEIGFKYASIKLDKTVDFEYLEAVTRDEDAAELFYSQDAKAMGKLFNARFDSYLDQFIYGDKGFHKFIMDNNIELTEEQHAKFIEVANCALFKKVNEAIYLQNKAGVNDVEAFNPVLRDYMIGKLYN